MSEEVSIEQLREAFINAFMAWGMFTPAEIEEIEAERTEKE